MKKKTLCMAAIILLIIALFAVYVLYRFNYIPHKKYSNAYFHIEPYTSRVDKDRDGVDDQTDILQSARAYTATKPKYKSQYYAGGYPDDAYGVCTDVVAFGLKGAGYDLMELVYADVKDNQNAYAIDMIDKNIDFRRVQNLLVYFERHAISLTTDIYDIEQWQGGDIVIFENHIGIVSNNRNKNGVSFIIHHESPWQRDYEEDILEIRNDLVAHYRIS